MNEQFKIGAQAHLVRSSIKSKDGWQKPDITDTSPSKASVWLGWSGNRADVLLQANTSFALADEKGRRIKRYTTVDLGYEYRWRKATFSAGVQNLFNKQYTTAWGERAKAFYGAAAPQEMFDYKGRGRTFTVGYRQRF